MVRNTFTRLVPSATIVLLLGLAGLFSLGKVQEALSARARPEVGFLAPDFVLPRLNEKVVKLSDLQGKKAIFLSFWATWCPSCRAEMPAVEKAYHRYKDQVEFLAVSIDQHPKDVEAFMKEFKLTFPPLLDPNTKVFDLYEVAFIPTHFFIDKAGRIRAKEIGPRDWGNLDSWKVFEELLR